MTIVGRIMAWLLPSRAPRCAVDARIADAMAEASRTTEVARRIVEESEAERADTNEIAGFARERLASLEARRVKRIRDPQMSVLIETMKIMERRS